MTHTNAYKDDARDKLAKAHTTLQEATDAVNALVDRYEQDVSETETPVETNDKEVPSENSVEKPTTKKK